MKAAVVFTVTPEFLSDVTDARKYLKDKAFRHFQKEVDQLPGAHLIINVHKVFEYSREEMMLRHMGEHVMAFHPEDVVYFGFSAQVVEVVDKAVR